MKFLGKGCVVKPKYLGLLAVITFLPACQTVQIPNLDFKRLPEFFEETRDISDYPKVSDVPAVPQEVRSSEAWDQAAKSLLSLRDANAGELSRIEIEGSSDSSLDVEALKAKVRAYKLDDPQ